MPALSALRIIVHHWTRFSKYQSHSSSSHDTALMCTAVGSVLSSYIDPTGSTCIQEHGQVYHPPGYCAALWGIQAFTHAPQSSPWKWKRKTGLLSGFKMCHLIFLSAGSHHTETRNNPLEKETGAVHGPQPSMFVFSLSRKNHNDQQPKGFNIIPR